MGGDTWRDLPVPDNNMQVEATPGIAINYGLYIAAFGVILAIAGAVMAWMSACQLCAHVETVRYQMLHAPLTEEEKGSFASPGRSYNFENKGGFRYDGYGRPANEVNF